MFTFPFCYTPTEDIIRASKQIINKIDNTPALNAVFKEGKMLGVLQAKSVDGEIVYLYAFSGLVGGKSHIEGFVGPIFDIADPCGHYRLEEAQISSESDPEVKKNKSRALQEWLFKQYVVLNARGEKKSIWAIFADKGIVPPGGTGDCAGPKLLQHAYSHSMEPLSMGEFWYGESSHKEIRIEGDFYPSCTGKCGPLLEFMLQGLEVEPNPLLRKVNEPYSILYEDEAIIVIDKPSGLLCVPGKTGEESLLEILCHKLRMKLYPCHRLDMDTSGIMLFAKKKEHYVCLSQQFEQRLTDKEYIARLCPPQLDGVSGFVPDSKGLAASGFVPDSKGLTASGSVPDSKGLAASGFVPDSEGLAASGSVPGSEGLAASGFVPDSKGLAASGSVPGSEGLDASGFVPDSKGLAASGSVPGSEGLAASGFVPDSKGLAGCGKISLPLICDWDDRPRQMVDFENGKEAITEFRIIGTLSDGSTIVRLHPLTGRTHQLRVHCAHPDGLGRPIMGDRLYGGGRSPAPGNPALIGDGSPAPGISARIGDGSPAPGIPARIGDGSPAPGIPARIGDRSPAPGGSARIGDGSPAPGSSARIGDGSPAPGGSAFTEGKSPAPGIPARPLYLHAAKLSFLHPLTGAPVSFESPVPAYFEFTDVASGDSEGQALPLRGSLPLVPMAASLPNPHSHSPKNNNK